MTQTVIDRVLALAQTPLLLGLVALAALLSAAFLLTRLRRAHKAAEVVDPKGSGHLDLQGIEPAPDLRVLDLRTPAQERAIDRALPRPRVPGARREHVVPAFLSLGPQAAGKSTVLAHTALRQPQGMPDRAFDTPSPPATWWSFDRARVLDIGGNLVLESGDEHSDDPSWRALLRRLRKRRRWRPADGVLLTLAAGELLATLSDDEAAVAARSRLANRAAAIHQKLVEAQSRLGMRLPVWVLITQCDAIAGYRVFASTLLDRERRQMLGWSNPEPLDSPYSASTASDALATIRPVIERLQLLTLADSSVDLAPHERLAFAAFPAALGALEAPLGIVLNQLFTPGAGTETMPLRGTYFCGGHGFEDLPSPHSLGSLVTTARASEPVHTMVDFLTDLFSYKVFHEWNLATPTRAATRRASRHLRLARALSISLAFVGPIALWWTQSEVARQADALERNFVVPATQAAKRPGRDLAVDQASVCALLDSAQTVEDYRLRTTLLPPSWRSKLARKVEASGTGVYQTVVFPTTERLLDARIEHLAAQRASITVGPIAPCPPSDANAHVALTPRLGSSFMRSAGLPTGVGAADDLATTGAASSSDGAPVATVGTATTGTPSAPVSPTIEPGRAAETTPARPASVELPALATGQITDLLTVPAYHTLDSLTAATQTAERGISRYNCFVENRCSATANDPLESFAVLVDTVYGREMAPPTLASRSFFRTVLADTRVAEAYSPSAHHVGLLRERAEDLGAAMLDRLYDQNVIVQDLESLRSQIRGIEQTVPETDTHAVYRRLLDAIDTAQIDLTRPEVRWMGQRALDLGPALTTLLDRIERTRLLGPAVSEPLTQLAASGFGHLGDRLAAYRTTTTGPLLARDDGGQISLALSTRTLALRDALRQLLGEPFMEIPDGPAPMLELVPPPGRYLRWDVPTLAHANTFYQSFVAYQATLPAVRTGLTANTEAAAKASLERTILGQMIAAQRFPELPSSFLPGQRKRLIATQVNNFEQAQEDLANLLIALTRPAGDNTCRSGPALPYCQLNATLLNQQQAILDSLELVLKTPDPYATAPGLGHWNGSGNLAFEAFEVADLDALESKLALARQQVENLADRYARPILEGLPLVDPWGLTAQRAFDLFTGILADSDDAKAKVPGNAIARLESFVSDDMVNASAASCPVAATTSCRSSATAAGLGATSRCGYFFAQRNELVRAVAAKCSALTASCGRQAYRRLTRTFRDRVAGLYPFSSPPSTVRQDEASPAALAALLHRYDQDAPAIKRLLALGRTPSTSTEPPLDPCQQWPFGAIPLGDPLRLTHDFARDLCSVRAFFAGFLTQRAKAPQALPSFDLQPTYRVSCQGEVGGSDVIRWQLGVDGRPIDATAATPTRWAFGSPVSQTFTWAKDGTIQPTTPTGANVRLEDPSVIFAYEDNWSLLRLLEENAAPPSDSCAGASEQLLRFDIPTVEAGVSGKAQLYVRIAVTPAGSAAANATPENQGPNAVLPLPTFPSDAPPLPATADAEGSWSCQAPR